MYNLIVSIDNNNNIGISDTNTLIYHFKKDINLFKNITINKSKQNVVIMGKNTYLSIPPKFRPLKDRINIILSNTLKDNNVLIFNDIKKILYYIEDNKKVINDVFIIGGKSIYNEFLKLKIIDYLYITKIYNGIENVNNNYIKFPDIDNKDWELIDSTIDNDVNIIDNKTYNISFNKYKFINHEELQYLNTMNNILNNGLDRNDRTGTGTISIFSNYIKYDIRNNIIPLLTTKRVFLRGIIEELLWFISGSSDANILKDKKVHIWDKNSSRSFLDSRGLINFKEGDIGSGYGHNLRYFGSKYKGMDKDYKDEGFDQLKYVIDLIKNNPTSRRILFNYWDPNSLNDVALPPCFTSGCKVVTIHGYKNIENIKENDLVLTHKNSYQKVNTVHKTMFSGIAYTLSIRGIIKFTVTTNHPFLTKRGWIKARDLKKNDLIGMRINKNSNIPIKYKNFNKEFYYILGLFIKCGFMYNNILCLTISLDSKNMTIEILEKIITNYEIIEQHDSNSCVIKCLNYPIELKDLLDNDNKIIPEFIQDLPIYILNIILHGFNDSNNLIFYCNDDKLLLSLQRLYLKINKYTYIIRYNNIYCLYKKDINIINLDDSILINNEYAWYKLKCIYKKDINEIVYNLDVQNHNSYIVNNICNHNCHLLYQFYINEKTNELSCQFYQRSQDYFLANNFNIISATVLTKMLAHISGYKPGYIYQTTGDTHIYKNHIEQCKIQMKRKPKAFPLLFIEDDNNINNIEDFNINHFKLINYNPDKKIYAEMSA